MEKMQIEAKTNWDNFDSFLETNLSNLRVDQEIVIDEKIVLSVRSFGKSGRFNYVLRFSNTSMIELNIELPYNFIYKTMLEAVKGLLFGGKCNLT